ncbi:MAG: glycoside hydrolase family 127 protein [Oscillospiraceae bacterium]|nr:glycoside hydrolase family 127 protein [Oscillospiraceae bacterium]
MNIHYLPRMEAQTPDRSPLQTLPMTRLPLGDVRCEEGWLYEQLRLMARGITGRLPEYGPYFRPERDGFLHPETASGWEEIPYWLRGFYPLAVLLDEPELLTLAHRYIRAILNSRDADGWFGPAHLKTAGRTPSGQSIPDLYPNMLLADTLCLYCEHTGDKAVPDLFRGFCAYCLSLSDEQFMPRTQGGRLRWQRIRAGGLLPSLYWYYRRTGDEDALALARRVHASIAQSSCPYIATHAVDFAQRFAYDAIYSQQSGDREDFARSERAYDTFAAAFGQLPRGTFAADEQIRPGAADPRQSFEPCGMVELAKSFYALLRISGSTLYADRTEDIMLNHFAPSFTPDYKQVCYLTASNGPIRSNYTAAPSHNGTKSHDRSYQLMTPNNRCCGHNTGMGWPWYAANLWQATFDGGLAAALYAPCKVNTQLEGKAVSLVVKTDYPFKDSVRVEVDFEGELPLYLRIPGWCKTCTCRVNGQTVWTGTQPGGWLRLCRVWHRGEAVELTFAMALSFTRWPANGSLSVDMGPLTYSVRIGEEYRIPADALAYNHPTPHLWDNYEIFPTTPWNYGLVLEGGMPSVQVHHVADALPPQPFDADTPPIILHAKARRIPQWQLQDDGAAELQQSPVCCPAPDETIQLIPMGCARLRMTCLPVVTDDTSCPTWQPVPGHIPPEHRPTNLPDPFASMDGDGPWKPEDEA